MGGFPLGHWIGTDGVDYCLRTTRQVRPNLQVGSYLEFEERRRGVPVHERKYESGIDLTWWMSSRVQLTGGFTYQRIDNPVITAAIKPFTESFAQGVRSNNRYLWAMLTSQF